MHLNSDLEVFGNEIWQYRSSSNRYTNVNKKYHLWRDFPGTSFLPFLMGMDNKLQGVLDSVIYERNNETGEWYKLSSMPANTEVKSVKQLSKMLVLFEYLTPRKGV